MKADPGTVRKVAVALFLAATAFFSLTASPHVTGYMPETLAVADGYVRTGFPAIPEQTFMEEALGHRGVDGREYGRAPLVRVLIQVPAAALGYMLDAAAGDVHMTTYRFAVARAMTVLMAAFVVLAAFLVLVMRGVGLRPAVGTAALVAIASLVWPYSKIGMETAAMGLTAGALLACVWAAERTSLKRWLVAGIATSLAIASKPYGIFFAAPVLVLLLPGFLAASWAQRARLVAAIVVPLAVVGAATAWYNAVRHGSPFAFGVGQRMSLTIGAAPVNWLGLLISPGKGLLVYSPVVVLGALGVRELYRRDRELALALVVPCVALIGFTGFSGHWSDETWGPRYLVPVAFLMLLPLPWWAVTRGRRRVLAATAALAVAIQLVGVLSPYSSFTALAPAVTGVPLFEQRTGDVPDSTPEVPYGRDGFRWVPELSPLVLQSKALASAALAATRGDGLVLTYRPFEGRATAVDVEAAMDGSNVRMPDLWWAHPAASGTSHIPLAILLLGALAYALLRLRELVRPPDARQGLRAASARSRAAF